jgi:hypothetical protein
MDKINVDTEEKDPNMKSIREKNKIEEQKYVKENKDKGKCERCLIY